MKEEDKLREEWKNWLYKKDGDTETYTLPTADMVADWWLTKIKEHYISKEKVRETLEDYSNWLHKNGYIDADYYTEEPKAIDTYLSSLTNQGVK